MTAISDRFAITIGSLSEMRLRTQPGNALSASTLNAIEVYMYDAGGNWIQENAGMTISVTLANGGGTLAGTLSAVIFFCVFVGMVAWFMLCCCVCKM